MPPSLQVPKFTIDPVALRKGWWGNTWKNWGEFRQWPSLHGARSFHLLSISLAPPANTRPHSISRTISSLTGYILLAFTGLYLIEAGYFTGMLFASEEIRGTDYRSRSCCGLPQHPHNSTLLRILVSPSSATQSNMFIHNALH
jgi:hypothetical protein